MTCEDTSSSALSDQSSFIVSYLPTPGTSIGSYPYVSAYVPASASFSGQHCPLRSDSLPTVASTVVGSDVEHGSKRSCGESKESKGPKTPAERLADEKRKQCYVMELIGAFVIAAAWWWLFTMSKVADACVYVSQRRRSRASIRFGQRRKSRTRCIRSTRSLEMASSDRQHRCSICYTPARLRRHLALTSSHLHRNRHRLSELVGRKENTPTSCSADFTMEVL